MVWSVARSFGLDDATAKDVTQTIWLKLIENLDRIEDPERLPGWLATTARREAMKVSKLRSRAIPTDFEYDVEDDATPVDVLLVESEERREVMVAFKGLDDMCRQLLRLLTAEPALSYEEISSLTDRPVGSIGPTRARCLERLRRNIERIKKPDGDSSQQGDNRA